MPPDPARGSGGGAGAVAGAVAGAGAGAGAVTVADRHPHIHATQPWGARTLPRPQHPTAPPPQQPDEVSAATEEGAAHEAFPGGGQRLQDGKRIKPQRPSAPDVPPIKVMPAR